MSCYREDWKRDYEEKEKEQKQEEAESRAQISSFLNSRGNVETETETETEIIEPQTSIEQLLVALRAQLPEIVTGTPSFTGELVAQIRLRQNGKPVDTHQDVFSSHPDIFEEAQVQGRILQIRKRQKGFTLLVYAKKPMEKQKKPQPRKKRGNVTRRFQQYPQGYVEEGIRLKEKS